MAARRAARAAARAAARSACDLDRPGRPDRSRADPAGEDVTELDSIPAGRIDQEGPYRITDFRAFPFRERRARPGLCPPSAGFPSADRPWGCGSLPNHAFPASLQCRKSTTDSISLNFYVVDSSFVVD